VQSVLTACCNQTMSVLAAIRGPWGSLGEHREIFKADGCQAPPGKAWAWLCSESGSFAGAGTRALGCKELAMLNQHAW
jgi:hypothetical protein